MAATEAGAEPPTAVEALADAGAWVDAERALEDAGVDPRVFDFHPFGHWWYSLRVAQTGVGPAVAPRAFVVPLPELVAPLTTDPAHPVGGEWSVQDVPALARLVAEAVLAGDLDAAAHPVESSS